jgi:hypothetical protein
MFGKTDRAIYFDVAEDDGVIPFVTAVIQAPKDMYEVSRVLDKEWDNAFDAQNRIVWRSTNLVIGKRGLCFYRDLDPLIKAAQKIGRLTIFIDESHQICNAWTSTPEFIRLIRLGRHWKINIVWISQRFATVHRELTANTDEFIFFRIWEPLDLDAISKRCGDVTAEKVRNLRRIKNVEGRTVPGEHLVFNVLEQ